ncbi:MAG TPA: ATP synthase subunit I [Methylomirabilota bacterium]|nr:ATP synthase subunit I [Methylomirabilota bacterium]
MTPSELTTRVMGRASVAVLALAALAAGLGGVTAGIGALVGGALAVGDFRWLAARTAAALSGAPAPGWPVLAGLRLGAVVAAAAGLLSTGWAHPLGLLAGFSVLPCTVVVQGLRAARAEGGT